MHNTHHFLQQISHVMSATCGAAFLCVKYSSQTIVGEDSGLTYIIIEHYGLKLSKVMNKAAECTYLIS